MRIPLLNLIIVSLLFSAGRAFPSTTDIIGTWEGESKCTVSNSPFHDEHALYKIFADKNDPAKLSLDGYKVVNGEAQFMGTLTANIAPAGRLSGAAPTLRNRTTGSSKSPAVP